MDPRVALQPGVGRTTTVASLAATLSFGACGDITSYEELGPDDLELRTLPAVSVGHWHACSLDPDGTAHCWGWNFFGQLGNAGQGDSSLATPAPITVNRQFVSLNAGARHSCAVTADYETYCWGSNEWGESGSPLDVNILSPLMIARDLEFHTIVTGEAHTCGLTLEGATHCWGLNSSGQLGVDTATASSSDPVAVSGGFEFIGLSAGAFHTCGLLESGDVYCWGQGTWERGTFEHHQVPVRVAMDSLRLAAISAGGEHTCGITEDLAALCWGAETIALGRGEDVAGWRPYRVSGGHRFVALSAGKSFWRDDAYTCGITIDRTAYCWGENSSGQLGTGDTTERAAPTPVVGDLEFEMITAGRLTTCGVTTDGDIYCWGANPYGTLGNGTFESSPVPLKVMMP